MKFDSILKPAVMVVSIFALGDCIRWLSLRHSDIKWTPSAAGETTAGRGVRSGARSPCGVARRRYGLAKLQAKLCRAATDAMPHVEAAAAHAADACKGAFRHRRWNCSSIDNAPHLSPDLTRATREQAYVYAVSAASLTFAMARACASGTLRQCTCAGPPRESPTPAAAAGGAASAASAGFKWGGCGDNVRWGSSFAKRFVDAVERYDAKAAALEPPAAAAAADRKMARLRAHVAAVNLHNNRIGRKIIVDSLQTQCKCHGVSGSCSIKTCWKSVSPMVDIGEKLLRKFTTAKEINKKHVLGEQKEGIVPKNELIYLMKSPDYCTKDEKLGSVGTVGRRCNVTSNGTDGCRQLCCGRGYRTVVEEKIERCQCKYYYCCYVKCKTCRTFTRIHECS